MRRTSRTSGHYHTRWRSRERAARDAVRPGLERWVVLAVLAGSILAARWWGVLNAWFLLPPALALALFLVAFTARRLRSRLSVEEAAYGSMMQEMGDLAGESERRIRELRTLYESSLTVSRSLGREDLLAGLVEDARQIAGAEVACAFLLEDERVTIVRKVGTDDLDQFHLDPGDAIPPGSVASRLVEQGEPLVVSSLGEDENMECAPDIPWTEMRSLVAIPLLSGDRVFGGVLLGSGEAGAFTGKEVRVLTILGNLASVTLEKLRFGNELSEHMTELKGEIEKLRMERRVRARLLGALARELREPVMAVQSLAGMLAGAGGGAGARLRRPMADAVMKKADQALGVVDEMDALGGTRPAVFAPARSGASLGDLVHEVAVKHTASAVRRGVLLKAPASSRDITILCHRGLLQEGLDLLLEYLVQGVHRDSVLSLALEAQPGTARVVINGQSSGELIEMLERGLAHRGPSAALDLSRLEGRHLSLAVTRSVIGEHGGMVRVDPRASGAFQIVMSLPLGRHVRHLPPEVTRLLPGGTDHSRILGVMTSLVADLTGARRATLLLIDGATNELYVQSACGMDDVEARHLRIPVGQGAIGRVADTGAPALQKDEVGTVTKTRLLAPLLWNSECFGVLEVREREGGSEFRERDLHLIQHLASVIARSLAREEDPDLVRQDLWEGLTMIASVSGSSFGERAPALSEPLATVLPETGPTAKPDTEPGMKPQEQEKSLC
ncbi:MAG: GAF domain-containing protein [Candidatus Eisenbacteria sp.]|nr:GAF domain-containing protein [Candidatus Eisenbacteria bacterium]